MPGRKIPVMEIERLGFSEDGRGIVVYCDASNFVIQSASPWTGVSISGTSGGIHAGVVGLPADTSYGWLKIHYVSGSTYGATGATCYIPVYRNLDTDIA